MVVSAVRTTARGEVGAAHQPRPAASSSACSTCPTLPASANDPNLSGRAAASARSLSLEPGERALALTSLPTEGPGLALGTRQGVVKRVNPEVLGRDEWEVISLKDGDEVVGAVELATGEETLCFVTAEAQLLHFAAVAVRPQGRSGGGMAGVKLGAGRPGRVVRRDRPGRADGSVVVTASGSATALPGTEPGAVKVTPFSEYPAKGRATGGVRCHRFLKGEDALVFAWAGTAPARAAAASGAPVELPGGRPGAGTAPGCPGASRSPPAPGPSRPAAVHAPVWKAESVLTRRPRPAVPAGAARCAGARPGGLQRRRHPRAARTRRPRR